MRNAIFKFLAKRIEKNTRLRKTSQSFVGSDGPDGVCQLAIGRGQLVRAPRPYKPHPCGGHERPTSREER